MNHSWCNPNNRDSTIRDLVHSFITVAGKNRVCNTKISMSITITLDTRLSYTSRELSKEVHHRPSQQQRYTCSSTDTHTHTDTHPPTLASTRSHPLTHRHAPSDKERSNYQTRSHAAENHLTSHLNTLSPYDFAD